MKLQQLSLILQAIAIVEGWDGPHDSILSDADDGWKTDKDGNPIPSSDLLNKIQELKAKK